MNKIFKNVDHLDDDSVSSSDHKISNRAETLIVADKSLKVTVDTDCQQQIVNRKIHGFVSNWLKLVEFWFLEA